MKGPKHARGARHGAGRAAGGQREHGEARRDPAPGARAGSGGTNSDEIIVMDDDDSDDVYNLDSGDDQNVSIEF